MCDKFLGLREADEQVVVVHSWEKLRTNPMPTWVPYSKVQIAF